MTTADDVRRAMGLKARSPALAVQCPHCRAGPGEPCHGRTRNGKPRKDPHPGRVDAAPNAPVILLHPPPT